MRVRMVLAIMLFTAFVVCDRMQISYSNENADTVYNRLMENIDFSNLLKLVK